MYSYIYTIHSEIDRERESMIHKWRSMEQFRIHTDINKMCQHNIHYVFLFFTLTLSLRPTFFTHDVSSKMYYAYSQQRQPHIQCANTMYIYLYIDVVYLYLRPEKCTVSFSYGKNQEKNVWKNLIQFRHIALHHLVMLMGFGWERKMPISIGNVTKFNNSINLNFITKFSCLFLVWYSKMYTQYITFYLDWIVLDIGHVDDFII